MKQSFLDKIGAEVVGELARKASRKAITEAHAHGLPVTLGKPDGTIYELSPDGEEKIIKHGSAQASQVEVRKKPATVSIKKLIKARNPKMRGVPAAQKKAGSCDTFSVVVVTTPKKVITSSPHLPEKKVSRA